MKKIAMISAVAALLSLPVVSSAEILFQDNFDNADYTSIPLGGAFGPTGKEWTFYYTFDPDATRSVEQIAGRLNIKTNSLGGARIGDGVFFKNIYTPEFNFFGDPAATTPIKRMFSLRGIRFGNITTTPKHFHNLAFYVSSNSSVPRFASSFVVTLNAANQFSVVARQNLTNKEIALFPNTTVPVTPDGVDVVLDPTNYRVVFVFPGGGLYFEGQHGLTRTAWERIDPVTPTGGLPGNFTPGIIASTAWLHEPRLADVSIDSFTVTDGN